MVLKNYSKAKTQNVYIVTEKISYPQEYIPKPQKSRNNNILGYVRPALCFTCFYQKITRASTPGNGSSAACRWVHAEELKEPNTGLWDVLVLQDTGFVTRIVALKTICFYSR